MRGLGTVVPSRRRTRLLQASVVSVADGGRVVRKVVPKLSLSWQKTAREVTSRARRTIPRVPFATQTRVRSGSAWLIAACFLLDRNRDISALGSGHSFSARIAKNWSTRIGSSPVRTLLPVPICDRSRLVHRARKQIWPGGRTGQECASLALADQGASSARGSAAAAEDCWRGWYRIWIFA